MLPLFHAHSSLADFPKVDLLIRTSGEVRISNFLLWEIAYSELYFCNTLWPDFDEHELDCCHRVFSLERAPIWKAQWWKVMLLKRILTAFIVAPIAVFGILLLTQTSFAFAVALILIISSWEYCNLIQIKHLAGKALFMLYLYY